jgi:hypothetical protein
MIRGGHRLWVAPEDAVLTYETDNVPVLHEETTGANVTLRNPASPAIGIAKELRVMLDPNEPKVTLQHTIGNEGKSRRQMASWALTVMAPGGVEIIPLPEPGEHPRDLLPNRLMVVWPYTDLSDERLTMGRKYIRISQRDGFQPLKLGLAHTERWIAYHVNGALFIKAFDLEAGAAYTDMGCNFETFTADGMLEVESLGPLHELDSGSSTSHTETWWLFDAPGKLPENEPGLGEWLKPYLTRAGLA